MCCRALAVDGGARLRPGSPRCLSLSIRPARPVSMAELQDMSADASLVFLFESGFQSWLLFAQNYVIADFLLLAPSRASCQACVLLLLSPGLGQTRGVPSESQGDNPLSASQAAC